MSFWLRPLAYESGEPGLRLRLLTQIPVEATFPVPVTGTGGTGQTEGQTVLVFSQVTGPPSGGRPTGFPLGVAIVGHCFLCGPS